jgi:hypothetical protein
MIHVNPSKVATRRACNRCHQTKLKCIVDSGRKCKRCKQSNSECTFSPPNRIQRQQMRSRSPSSTAVNPTEHQFDSWPSVDFDWGDLSVEPSQLASGGFDAALHPAPIHYSDNDELMRNSVDYTADLVELPTPSTLFDTSASITAAALTSAATTNSASHNTSGPPGLPTNSIYATERHAITTSTNLSSDGSRTDEHDRHPIDLAFWADKTTQLFVMLTQHVQSLPNVNPDSLHHDQSDGMVPSPSRSHNPDRTFDLSESFINVLSGMCFKLPPTDASAAAGEGCSAKYLILDEPSYFLIFSVYLRFLEMHDTIFRYLLACLSHKHESSEAGSCFYLPKLVLGSFSLAMTSETRPLLFVNLMESMLGRAKALFHRLASAKNNPGSEGGIGSFGGLPPILEPAFALQAVLAREASIVHLVDRIKTTLSQPRSFQT